MIPNQQFCFTHPSGEDIYLYTLSNAKDTKVSISNFGAIIRSFKIRQDNGTVNDIVLGFDKMEDYCHPGYLEHYPWFGAAVGRYGNRIKNGAFEIDGRTYELSRNNGNDQLHGGDQGFDKKAWHLISITATTLQLAYTSPDGEEGFPGNLQVALRFELNDNDEFSYEYTAITDQPTAVNLTHHGYFNLDNGQGTIQDHEVRIDAQEYLAQDENFVATGELMPTRDTPHDFTKWKKIGSDGNPADGYDQSFVTGNLQKELALAAEARSARSNIQLSIWTTEPVVHFYTGKWIPRIKGKNGILYEPHSGFCLETQVHPNAINIPHFPNTILRPGEKYYHKTVYRISR